MNKQKGIAMKIKQAVWLLLALSSAPAMAQVKRCDDLKNEIAAKLDAKHVASYVLKEVEPGNVEGANIVGSCDGGTKRIVYEKRTSAKSAQ